MLNLVSDHPNVAELVEVFEDTKAISLVLELCLGGELFDRVVAKGTFTERMAAGGISAPGRSASALVVHLCSLIR